MSWRKNKKTIVYFSSNEAKHKDLCSSTCEAVWFMQVLEDIGEEKTVRTFIKCDNQSSIKLAKDHVYHAISKHIEAHYNFVRENIQSKEIDLIYCNTHENVADIFTKPLGKAKFEIFRNQLGVVENSFLH